MATQVTLNSGSVDSAGSLALKTNGTTTAVTIDTSQNVGIGTSSPTVKLDVVTASGASYVRTYNGTIDFYSGVQTAVGGALVGTVSNHPVTFFSNNAERARIDTSGNLMVGTTSQIEGGKLSVSGANSIGVNITDLNGGGINANYTAGSGTAYYGYWKYGGALVGYITSTGSTVNYTSISDHRLKNTIEPMTGALAKVAQLKPCTYKWNSDGSDGQGFIAHELAEVVPDCVVGEKDAVDAEGNPRYQGVDTSFLVATLTAAIQEQQAIITSLTDRITALEAK